MSHAWNVAVLPVLAIATYAESAKPLPTDCLRPVPPFHIFLVELVQMRQAGSAKVQPPTAKDFALGLAGLVQFLCPDEDGRVLCGGFSMRVARSCVGLCELGNYVETFLHPDEDGRVLCGDSMELLL